MGTGSGVLPWKWEWDASTWRNQKWDPMKTVLPGPGSPAWVGLVRESNGRPGTRPEGLRPAVCPTDWCPQEGTGPDQDGEVMPLEHFAPRGLC